MRVPGAGSSHGHVQPDLFTSPALWQRPAPARPPREAAVLRLRRPGDKTRVPRGREGRRAVGAGGVCVSSARPGRSLRLLLFPTARSCLTDGRVSSTLSFGIATMLAFGC